MIENLPNKPLDKVNEWINTLTSKFDDLKKNVIDDNLDKLQFWDKLSDLLGKVNKTFNINLFGLGTASSLLGLKIFDIEKYKKKWGIWNVIFNKYGGVEWLHKKYVEETLSGFFTDQPEKIKTISTLYTTYDKEKQNNISSWITDPDSFAMMCNLWLDEKTPKLMIDKLPQIKVSYLSKKIQEGIQGKEQNLDPNILASAGCSVPKKVGPLGTEIIDTASPDWKPERITDKVIQEYLTTQTKQLYEDTWFIKNIQSSDHFVLSLMGGLFVNGNTFAESVLLGVKKPEEFGWVVLGSKNTLNEGKLDMINGKIDFSTWNFTVEQIKNINYLIDEMSTRGITNPYTQIGILSCIAKESGFIPQNETSYSTTDNARIREIFWSRVTLSNAELDDFKKKGTEAFDKMFFDMVYGKDATKALWRKTWNTEIGDWYTYRGRGFNGITFKSSYKHYGDVLWKDLVANPELLNEPEIAAKAALEFFTQGSAWKDLSALSFTDKETAVKHFAAVNAGGRAGADLSKALAASKKFVLQENLA